MPVGLHDDRAENPADAPPALQQAGRGSSRPAASGSRTRGSRPCVGHGLLPVPVAPGGAGGGVLAPLGTEPHTRLGLDQFLQQPLGGPADEFKTICPTQRLTQAKQVVLGQGHRAPWSELPVHPGQLRGGCQLSRQQTPADGAPQGAETRALTCCRGRAARKRRAEPAPRCPRGGQAGEASGGDGSPGRKPIYQGLHHVVSPTTELPHQVGKNSLRGSGSGGPAVLMSLHPVPPVGAAVVASVIAQSYVA